MCPQTPTLARNRAQECTSRLQTAPEGRLQLPRRRVIGEDDATGIRDNDDWVYRQAASPDAICNLEQLAVDIPLASLYRKITFPEL